MWKEESSRDVKDAGGRRKNVHVGLLRVSCSTGSASWTLCAGLCKQISWRTITLRNCGGFAIHQWASAMGIHVSPLPCTSLPPPSPPHPSRLSQSTAFGCPASCIQFPMTLCLPMGMYVSMLFSQITPPSPPTESTSLFFLSAPPLLPRVGLLNAGRLEDPDG